MNSILLFAGTTEGRRIAEALRDAPVSVTVSVATEYGETLIAPAGNVHAVFGRKNADEIEALLKETQASLLIDATHPYAAEITKTLKSVAEKTGTEYLRVLRASEQVQNVDYSPWEGFALTGRAEKVFLRGVLSAACGRVLRPAGGKYLLRRPAAF